MPGLVLNKYRRTLRFSYEDPYHLPLFTSQYGSFRDTQRTPRIAGQREKAPAALDGSLHV